MLIDQSGRILQSPSGLAADRIDGTELLIPNGEYDEESGWVKNVMRLGVLRRNPDSDDPKYIITDFGTGW